MLKVLSCELQKVVTSLVSQRVREEDDSRMMQRYNAEIVLWFCFLKNPVYSAVLCSKAGVVYCSTRHPRKSPRSSMSSQHIALGHRYCGFGLRSSFEIVYGHICMYSRFQSIHICLSLIMCLCDIRQRPLRLIASHNRVHMFQLYMIFKSRTNAQT